MTRRPNTLVAVRDGKAGRWLQRSRAQDPAPGTFWLSASGDCLRIRTADGSLIEVVALPIGARAEAT